MKDAGMDGDQLDEALAKICDIVRDGVKRGHFRMTVTCSVAKRGVRHLVVEPGDNHFYRIRPKDPEAKN